MNFDETTPSAMFSAISLLLLAYTNSFPVTANRIRELCLKARTTPGSGLTQQIANLRQRVRLIRGKQTLGVGSLLASVAAMLLALSGEMAIGRSAFAAGLVLLFGSLATALREISLSLDAPDLELGSEPS